MTLRFEYRPYRAVFRQPVITAHGAWREREGVLVRLSDESGLGGLGEIAPLPGWGSETLDDALCFCAAMPSTIDATHIRSIPTHLPACTFALESAWDAARQPAAPSPVRELSVAALLPAGPGAVEAAAAARQSGYTTMKWKVGVGAPDAEIALLPRVLSELPHGGRLRVDANCAWDLPTARRWLRACEGCPVEFVEQPFPVGHEQPIFELASEYSTRLALDESVARTDDLRRWLDFGWPGIYVIKPSLAGSPRRLLQLLESYEAEAVFSGAFETAVGSRAALLVAARAEHSGRAVGFGTIGCFADERLNLPDTAPTIPTKWLARHAPAEPWEAFSHEPRAA